MPKSVYMFCGPEMYEDALELQELLSVAGIEAELVSRETTQDLNALLREGQDKAVNVDVFITIHSEIHTRSIALATLFVHLVDATLEIGNGLFVSIVPLPIFGRWDNIGYHLSKIDAAQRKKNRNLLISKIREMIA